jgi:hypothetical protein
LFELEGLMPLLQPIERKDSAPIQNRIYKKFEVFASAREFRDLYVGREKINSRKY